MAVGLLITIVMIGRSRDRWIDSIDPWTGQCSECLRLGSFGERVVFIRFAAQGFIVRVPSWFSERTLRVPSMAFGAEVVFRVMLYPYPVFDEMGSDG